MGDPKHSSTFSDAIRRKISNFLMLEVVGILLLEDGGNLLEIVWEIGEVGCNEVPVFCCSFIVSVRRGRWFMHEDAPLNPLGPPIPL